MLAAIVSKLIRVVGVRFALALLPRAANNGANSVVPVYEEMALVKSVAMATP